MSVCSFVCLFVPSFLFGLSRMLLVPFILGALPAFRLTFAHCVPTHFRSIHLESIATVVDEPLIVAIAVVGILLVRVVLLSITCYIRHSQTSLQPLLSSLLGTQVHINRPELTTAGALAHSVVDRISASSGINGLVASCVLWSPQSRASSPKV